MSRQAGGLAELDGGLAACRPGSALSRDSEFVACRQAQVINALTIVATVFLPLLFLTGYFAMNFRILTADVQTTLWQFILLGLLLMIVSVALSAAHPQAGAAPRDPPHGAAAKLALAA